ncbi:hypothetical protein DSECCO2_440620 [anaerobic digester metagenome]
MGVGRELLIHVGCSFEQKGFIAFGGRVAGKELQIEVVILHLVDANALGLLAVKLLGQGHDGFSDLIAVNPGIGLSPVGTSHPGVGYGNEVVIAEFLADPGPDLYQRVIDLVEFFRIFGKPVPGSVIGPFSHAAVHGFHEGRQSRQIALLAFEVYLCGSGELLVFGNQLVLFHQIVDDFRRENLALNLKLLQKMLSVFFFKSRPELRLQADPGCFAGDFLEARQLLVHGVLLRLVEVVSGINGITDKTQRGHGVKVIGQCVQVFKGFEEIRFGCGLLHFDQVFLHVGIGLVKIRTLVVHFTECHLIFLLLILISSGGMSLLNANCLNRFLFPGSS